MATWLKNPEFWYQISVLFSVYEDSVADRDATAVCYTVAFQFFVKRRRYVSSANSAVNAPFCLNRCCLGVLYQCYT